MFKKFLSKIGIGAATIDLVLETDTVRMGETVRGELVVTGGEVEQAIEGIQVDLVVTSQYEVDDAVRHVRETVARQTISDASSSIRGKRRPIRLRSRFRRAFPSRLSPPDTFSPPTWRSTPPSMRRTAIR